MPERKPDLETLVHHVQASDRYSAISPELVRALLAAELGKRRSPKEAVKAARTKLHQAAGVYQQRTIPYTALENELDQLPPDLADPAVQEFLRRAMGFHSSTRERLPILPRFFNETLASLGSIHSILDVACGLNPLAIPWMPLEPCFHYTACDIYSDMIAFLDHYIDKFTIHGSALVCDITNCVPPVRADLALVLKTLPCLEQLDKEIGSRLLEQLDCPNVLVSFPAQSLSGRSKGMPRFYENHFNDLLSGKDWRVTRLEFPGELAFLVQK